MAVFIIGLWNIIVGTEKSKINDLSVDYSEEGNIGVGRMGGMNLSTQSAKETAVAPMDVSENMTENQGISQDKRVIKDGTLSLKVKRTEEAVSEIAEIVKRKGGEIFSTNLNEFSKGQKSGMVVVKVPVREFEIAISEIKKVATQVVNEYTSGQDVTEQYVDLQAQLKNKQAEEQTFVGLLDRSGKLDDVLAVTREISRVRGEIERLQGKIRYLESQTDMATIAISLSEDVEVAPVGSGWRPGQVFKQAVSDLVKSAQGFVDNLIRFLIIGLPSIVVFLIIFWIAWLVIKKITTRLKG
ncbi:MAG: hypothetical protein US44_C0009G0011 [Candidatus Moranbacteria bacterium GW2011_GWD1_37_17]|nr:MAG: hypothetical protein US44_C0009G0011 [Candidatus Moranbacteria bacterium GW2011_GWD1_37_17]